MWVFPGTLGSGEEKGWPESHRVLHTIVFVLTYFSKQNSEFTDAWVHFTLNSLHFGKECFIQVKFQKVEKTSNLMSKVPRRGRYNVQVWGSG